MSRRISKIIKADVGDSVLEVTLLDSKTDSYTDLILSTKTNTYRMKYGDLLTLYLTMISKSRNQNYIVEDGE